MARLENCKVTIILPGGKIIHRDKIDVLEVTTKLMNEPVRYYTVTIIEDEVLDNAKRKGTLGRVGSVHNSNGLDSPDF